jgi:hypothetical protein
MPLKGEAKRLANSMAFLSKQVKHGGPLVKTEKRRALTEEELVSKQVLDSNGKERALIEEEVKEKTLLLSRFFTDEEQTEKEAELAAVKAEFEGTAHNDILDAIDNNTKNLVTKEDLDTFKSDLFAKLGAQTSQKQKATPAALLKEVKAPSDIASKGEEAQNDILKQIEDKMNEKGSKMLEAHEAETNKLLEGIKGNWAESKKILAAVDSGESDSGTSQGGSSGGSDSGTAQGLSKEAKAALATAVAVAKSSKQEKEKAFKEAEGTPAKAFAKVELQAATVRYLTLLPSKKQALEKAKGELTKARAMEIVSECEETLRVGISYLVFSPHYHLYDLAAHNINVLRDDLLKGKISPDNVNEAMPWCHLNRCLEAASRQDFEAAREAVDEMGGALKRRRVV